TSSAQAAGVAAMHVRRRHNRRICVPRRRRISIAILKNWQYRALSFESAGRRGAGEPRWLSLTPRRRSGVSSLVFAVNLTAWAGAERAASIILAPPYTITQFYKTGNCFLLW